MGELEGWKYCPRCSSGLEVENGGSSVRCGECGFRTYAGSRPTASALCLDEAGRVLLARRAHEPDEGLWDLPGGFLDEGEHPLDGLRRELREEAGVEIRPLEFFCIVMDRYGDEGVATLNIYWTARIAGGELEPADDVAELRWFAPDELPGPAELAFRNNEQVLSVWRARHEDA